MDPVQPTRRGTRYYASRTGWGDQKDWDQTIALLKQYRDVATDKPWTAFHTNEFLPNAASN